MFFLDFSLLLLLQLYCIFAISFKSYSSNRKYQHDSSVISDSTTTASCITEVALLPSSNEELSKKQQQQLQQQQHLAQNVKEVAKLQNLCATVEADFVSTKNDMGNLQVFMLLLHTISIFVLGIIFFVFHRKIYYPCKNWRMVLRSSCKNLPTK